MPHARAVKILATFSNLTQYIQTTEYNKPSAYMFHIRTMEYSIVSVCVLKKTISSTMQEWYTFCSLNPVRHITHSELHLFEQSVRRPWIHQGYKVNLQANAKFYLFRA